jgi:predicted dehydrogenase
MKSILLVGAGQLGSRYLQGMTQKLENTKFIAVEPNPQAAATAKERFSQVESRSGNTLTIVRDLKECGRDFDAAIIATTAATRLSALQETLAGSRVRKVVLEKVLFQDRPSYYAAEEMLKEAGARAWVNCPRRTFDIYKKTRLFFGDDSPIRIEVSGGAWGMACNGVHFLDLAAYLFGTCPISAEGSGLRPGALDSKRPGFLEVEGTLLADYGRGHTLSLYSDAASKAGVLVAIRGDAKTAVIDESNGVAFFKEPERSWRQENFRMPPLSEYSGAMIERIIEETRADIPEYEESMRVHLPFIDALCEHWGVKKCSIT